MLISKFVVFGRTAPRNRFNGHTFGIPILDCPMGTLDASSTNVKCNGSGMHAIRPERMKKMNNAISWIEMLSTAHYAAYGL